MKTQLLTIAIGILALGGISAEPVAKITFGTPHQKVFPADDSSPRRAYIELPVTITNTSTHAIRFGTNAGPQFKEYVQRRTNSKHWSDITQTAPCGMGFSVFSLEPGKTLESTILINPDHGGHGYRLALPIYEPGPNLTSKIKIKSEPIVLPKIKG
jgi:hypothetical protein